MWLGFSFFLARRAAEADLSLKKKKKISATRRLMHLRSRRTDNAFNGQTSSHTLSYACVCVDGWDRRLRSCTQISPYWLNLLTNEFGGKVLLRVVDLGVTVHRRRCQTSHRAPTPWSDGKLWLKTSSFCFFLLKRNTSKAPRPVTGALIRKVAESRRATKPTSWRAV